MEQIAGTASLRRIGRFGFPVFELVSADGNVLARLGRSGWFRVFLFRGQRVDLADGTRWRLRAGGYGPYIVPVVAGESGKLAIALPETKRSYGINGRDYAYHFYSDAGRRFRAKTWTLREHEDDVAEFGRQSVTARRPVPLAAALLCFTLMKYGIPGEGRFGIPELRWT